MDWKPIKTAPKDGTWFLGGWYFQGRWVGRLGQWNKHHRVFYEKPGAHIAPFTHWLPLPEPPKP